MTLVVFALGVLNIALSNGDVAKQKPGVLLIFRALFVLCGADIILFLAMAVVDATRRSVRSTSLWPYVLFALVMALLLLFKQQYPDRQLGEVHYPSY